MLNMVLTYVFYTLKKRERFSVPSNKQHNHRKASSKIKLWEAGTTELKLYEQNY